MANNNKRTGGFR